ncbi:hypothetical protein TNCT_278491 [Trichonephila clavata]|uniref:Uncharacterized protein n=1 Tax=Trichonephila clavata TaxID=2740835 RepID=A0A8X6JRZ3_TRICU|nr:hypothetical protein TNCT_706451 [Trichonephila clavata]GFR23702.1 hypothetical protein TNCT_278491 [Trichonephila clavata]
MEALKLTPLSELMQAVPEGQVDGQPVFPVLEDQFSGFAQVLLTEAGRLFHTLSYIMRAVLAINPQVNQDAVSLSIVDRYLDSIQSYLSEEGRPSSLDFKTLLLPINLKVEKKLLFY